MITDFFCFVSEIKNSFLHLLQNIKVQISWNVKMQPYLYLIDGAFENWDNLHSCTFFWLQRGWWIDEKYKL